MILKFSYFGRHVGTRFAGANMREQITSSFRDKNHCVFDFEGVETISASFADECFGKLVFDFDINQIKRKTVFQNTRPAIKLAILNAYQERLLSGRD